MNCSFSENELFEFMSGGLDAAQAETFEAHLSECELCALGVALIREMKLAAMKPLTNEAEVESSFTDHPDIGKLAEFFYETASPAVTRELAAHVALCSYCSTLLAQHAEAAALALEYDPAEHKTPMAESAWKFIDEWEQAGFSDIRPLSNQHTSKTIETILALFRSKEAEIAEAVAQESKGRDVVPVLIVDRLGSYRRLELFERTEQERNLLRQGRGLKHSQEDSLLHTIVEHQEGYSIVSRPIGEYRVEALDKSSSAAPIARFIVEY